MSAKKGPISSITATKDIAAGEEIFVNYNYPKDVFPFDHLWYQEMKAQYLQEEEDEKRKSNDALTMDVGEEKKGQKKKSQKKRKKNKKKEKESNQRKSSS